METRPHDEPTELAKTTTIQEVPEEMTTEITEKQEIEITDEETLDHDTILATLETDNIYPLDKRYGSTQKLAYHRHSASRNQLTKRRKLSQDAPC